ncbi:hypothetical protein [Actinoplanes sp. NBRC 103695]|uniref:hypothetical protein n=1 Tax=Actinoplanes sp. NBRC 103695 TaxID=3032202 RepID=UPI0024A56B40|nr:hypothetical protein [Actinoplanes sp. NBRC 103695]GLZ00582.1 hypothetical protein Acsp02_78340 [Actinoplanes sp. NBRC 103695]
MSTYNSDDSRRYWLKMLSQPGALVIDGNLYFVGPEPDPADLAANPKLHGCYGTGFTIGHADGTQTVTHNLGCCGAIPGDVRPADNAAFIGQPELAPKPAVLVHNHFDHLDYIGGHYPFECLVCYRRFEYTEVPSDVAETLLASLLGDES